MTFNQYQQDAQHTNHYPKDRMLEALTLGLCSEAGEIAGKIKKALRGDGDLDKQALAHEIGDVLWYVAMLAREAGYTLEDVAEMNIEKLARRHEHGTIKGDGDNR